MKRIVSPRLLTGLAVAGVATVGLLATPAHAWNHFFTVWVPESMPIRVFVADDGVQGSFEDVNNNGVPDNCDDSDGLSGCCEETVPGGYCYEATRIAFDTWADVPCTEIIPEVLDGVTNPEFVTPNVAARIDDGRNTVTFNDPTGQLAEASTRAAAFFSNLAGEQAFILNGQPYFQHAGSVDIVFNDGTVFASDEEIEGGGCAGAAAFQATMTHEVGHFLGMAHTCEQDEPCTDPLFLDATMFWTGPNCDVARAELGEDDIEGITALYGPSARFSCSHEAGEDQVIGVVPFELRCVIVSDFISEITEASWQFGDGGTSTELAAAHTYTEAGNYTIQVEFQGEREACGEEGWTNQFRRVGYVRACDIPDAKFEVEQLDGLTYQMLNDSDVSVFGCISDIQWDVFEGEGTDGDPIFEPIKAWEPVLEFPEPGTYTVAMSLGGIAGTGGAVATFEVTRFGGGNGAFGCATGGAAPFGGVGLLLLGGLLVARRRRD